MSAEKKKQSPRPGRKSLERRARIIDATLELLREGGLEGLSMRLLAERSGISLGNLQYHFKTRQDVLQALTDQFLSDYLEACRNIPAPGEGTSVEAAFRQLLENETDEDCAVVFKEIWALSHRDEACRLLLEGYYRQLRELLSDWLTPVVQPEPEALNLVIALLEGYCITGRYLGRESHSIARQMARLVEGGD